MSLCDAGPGKLSEERELRSARGVDVNRDRRGQGCQRAAQWPGKNAKETVHLRGGL